MGFFKILYIFWTTSPFSRVQINTLFNIYILFMMYSFTLKIALVMNSIGQELQVVSLQIRVKPRLGKKNKYWGIDCYQGR